MNQDTIKCIHCGAELPQNQEVCVNCGCRPFKEYTITINRKSAFTGSILPLSIDIYNTSVNMNVSIKNGEAVNVTLPAGDYNFKMSLGTVFGEFKVTVNNDVAFETGIKLGMFVNKLYLQTI